MSATNLTQSTLHSFSSCSLLLIDSTLLKQRKAKVGTATHQLLNIANGPNFTLLCFGYLCDNALQKKPSRQQEN
jgi:hypothetical protein